MKTNITLTADEELIRAAREIAQRQGVSLNELVRRYLESLVGRPSGEELVERLQKLWRDDPAPRGGGRFNRDEVYEDRIR